MQKTTQKKFVVVDVLQFKDIQFYHYDGQENIHFHLGTKIIYGSFKKKNKVKSQTKVVFEFFSLQEKQTKILKNSLKLISCPQNLTGYFSILVNKGFKQPSTLSQVTASLPKGQNYQGTIKMKDLLQNCCDCFVIYQEQKPFAETSSQDQSSSSQLQKQEQKEKEKKKKEEESQKKSQFNIGQEVKKKEKKQSEKNKQEKKPLKGYKYPHVQVLADYRIHKLAFTKK